MRIAYVLSKSLVRCIDGQQVSIVYPRDDRSMQLAIKRAVKAGYKIIGK